MEPSDRTDAPGRPPAIGVRTPSDATAVYATATVVRVGQMVWLDFYQADPHSPDDKPRATCVGRVVLVPEAARFLIEQLSEQVPDEDSP